MGSSLQSQHCAHAGCLAHGAHTLCAVLVLHAWFAGPSRTCSLPCACAACLARRARAPLMLCPCRMPGTWGTRAPYPVPVLHAWRAGHARPLPCACAACLARRACAPLTLCLCCMPGTWGTRAPYPVPVLHAWRAGHARPLPCACAACLARRARLSRALSQYADECECTLCLKLLYEPVTTPCGHSFWWVASCQRAHSGCGFGEGPSCHGRWWICCVPAAAAQGPGSCMQQKVHGHTQASCMQQGRHAWVHRHTQAPTQREACPCAQLSACQAVPCCAVPCSAATCMLCGLRACVHACPQPLAPPQGLGHRACAHLSHLSKSLFRAACACAQPLLPCQHPLCTPLVPPPQTLCMLCASACSRSWLHPKPCACCAHLLAAARGSTPNPVHAVRICLQPLVPSPNPVHAVRICLQPLVPYQGPGPQVAMPGVPDGGFGRRGGGMQWGAEGHVTCVLP